MQDPRELAKPFFSAAGEPDAQPAAHATTAVAEELVRELLSAELDQFTRRAARSRELAQRAVEVLPQGVPTSVSAASPFPLFIERGEGARVWDRDGNEYADYFNGFGVSVFGHSDPRITQAVCDRAQRGVHFGAASEESVEWAEELTRRLGLNWIRFSQSGTEATMDAVRLARAHTGREILVKIEGGYHGSHPEALVSTNLPLDETAGEDHAPRARPFGEGILASTVRSVRPVAFNDLGAVEWALRQGDVAAVIVEPILFNVGAIFPQPGYLEGLRELCDRYEVTLIFDETKTAATVAHGGASELFGVRPDLKTMGKGIGGGLGCGAIGGTEAWGYDLVESWKVPHLSTFAANPLTAAAGRAAMCEVLTSQAYRTLETHRLDLSRRLERVIVEWELPAYVNGAGGKGCVVWADPAGGALQDFRDYKRRFDFPLGTLAWIWVVNRGVLLAPGQDEQWTHSIQHTEREAEEFSGALEELAKRLRS